MTSQINKIEEGIIDSLFDPQFVNNITYGRKQFAYMPERGAHGASAQLELTWILMISRQRKIAEYCSDVSGAFDKATFKDTLQKLRARGVLDAILQVMQY